MGESAKTFRVSLARGLRGLGLVVAALAGIGVLASDAHAAKVRGAITGHLFLVNPVWEEANDADRHTFSFREPVPTVRAEFRRLFPHIPKELCIAALSVEKQAAQKPVLIRVGGGRTTPVTIVVTPGTQLQFQNTDPFAHRLYGVNVPTFAANDTVKGGIRSWAVPAPGTYEIRDQSAPSLRMFVIAEPNLAAISYPSLRGEFAMALEAGDYQLQAFFAGKKVGPATPVTVAGKDIDISARPIKVGEAKNEKAK
jgi:hypothetical protein